MYVILPHCQAKYTVGLALILNIPDIFDILS